MNEQEQNMAQTDGSEHMGEKPRYTQFILISLIVCACVGVALFVQSLYQQNVVPEEVSVMLGEDLGRMDVAHAFGDALEWSDEERQAFASVYAQIQWDGFKAELGPVVSRELALNDHEYEIFMISSREYLSEEYDVTAGVYSAGEYVVSRDISAPQLAQMLVEQVREAHPDTESLEAFLTKKINPETLEHIQTFVQQELEYLPDLVPLPPRDVTLVENKNSVLLAFSTIYYNQGEGPLELRGDPKTAGIAADLERDVFQRIYRADGSYRDRHAGTFLWHQPHLHYHFADFVVYDLEAVDADGQSLDVHSQTDHSHEDSEDEDHHTIDLSQIAQKSTFCVRDISRIDIELEHTPHDAGYKICGKERQGISVGWGDTYFYTYPDQNLNISGIPSGTYRLSFIVNPSDRFDEITTDNNTSSALLKIDMENKTVEVLEETPSETPEIQHVYEQQVFD